MASDGKILKGGEFSLRYEKGPKSEKRKNCHSNMKVILMTLIFVLFETQKKKKNDNVFCYFYLYDFKKFNLR